MKSPSPTTFGISYPLAFVILSTGLKTQQKMMGKTRRRWQPVRNYTSTQLQPNNGGRREREGGGGVFLLPILQLSSTSDKHGVKMLCFHLWMPSSIFVVHISFQINGQTTDRASNLQRIPSSISNNLRLCCNYKESLCPFLLVMTIHKLWVLFMFVIYTFMIKDHICSLF